MPDAFPESKCDLTPIEKIDTSPLLSETIPGIPETLQTCLAEPITPFPPEPPCSTLKVGKVGVAVTTGETPSGSFEFGIVNNGYCDQSISALLTLQIPEGLCPEMTGDSGSVYIELDDNGNPITTPRTETRIIAGDKCSFTIISDVFLPDLSGCPEFTIGAETGTIGNVGSSLPTVKPDIEIVPGDNCTFTVNLAVAMEGRPLVTVIPDSTLPEPYDGDIALLGRVAERSGVTLGGGYAAGAIGGKEVLRTGIVYIMSANGIPLQPNQWYNAKEAGQLTQGGVTRQLYLVEGVEAIVKTPSSMPDGWTGATAVVGKFIVRRPSDGADVEAGEVFIQGLNNSVLPTQTKFHGIWAGRLTQSSQTRIFCRVEDRLCANEQGNVTGVYCSGGQLYVVYA